VPPLKVPLACPVVRARRLCVAVRTERHAGIVGCLLAHAAVRPGVSGFAPHARVHLQPLSQEAVGAAQWLHADRGNWYFIAVTVQANGATPIATCGWATRERKWIGSQGICLRPEVDQFEPHRRRNPSVSAARGRRTAAVRLLTEQTATSESGLSARRVASR
jgi:hypothetical protein